MIKIKTEKCELMFNKDILIQAITNINNAKIELDKALFNISIMSKRKRKKVAIKPFIEDWYNSYEQLCWYESLGLIDNKIIKSLFKSDIEVFIDNKKCSEKSYPFIHSFYNKYIAFKLITQEQLDMNKIKEKQCDFISTQEALKDITPFTIKDGE